jgi:hypothetical protein
MFAKATKILLTFLLILVYVNGFCGDNKYNSKGAGQSKNPTQTVIEQQTYMHWLQQGCPSFIAPRYNIQSEPRDQSQQRPLPTWGSQGVSGVTKGRTK